MKQVWMKWALMKKVRCYSAALLVSVWSLFPNTLSANEPLPDMAFLEYLAELVEVDGELIGPQDLSDKIIKPLIKPMKNNKQLKTENKQENDKNKSNSVNDNQQEDK